MKNLLCYNKIIGDKDMAIGLFDYVDRDSINFFYDEDKISTYMPFDSESDLRDDGYGQRLRDKEFLICRNETEIAAYAPYMNGKRYCKVGYAEFERDKSSSKKQMKLWYISVREDYEGLGLGSMLIAGVKHECVMQKIDTLVLDAARRYKQKGPTTEDRYPQLKGDGHMYYNANLALYQSHGFEVDRNSAEYKENMEHNFMDSSPIPMVCKINGMVVPQSLDFSSNQAPKTPTQDGGMCQ